MGYVAIRSPEDAKWWVSRSLQKTYASNLTRAYLWTYSAACIVPNKEGKYYCRECEDTACRKSLEYIMEQVNRFKILKDNLKYERQVHLYINTCGPDDLDSYKENFLPIINILEKEMNVYKDYFG